MEIYFSYRAIPEMQSVPKPERRQLWQAFLKSHGYYSRESLASFGPLLLLQVAAAPFLPQLGAFAFVLLFICAPIVSSAFYIALMRKPFRKFINSGVAKLHDLLSTEHHS